MSIYQNGRKLSEARISNTFSTAAPLTASFTKRYKYDHAGRLMKTWHQVDSEQEVLLSENEYNELGQVVDKNLYSTEPESIPDGQRSFKQSVDYRYIAGAG